MHWIKKPFFIFFFAYADYQMFYVLLNVLSFFVEIS